MSSESDNAEKTRLLLRTISSDEFSFIVVQYNHASLIAEIEQAIHKKYPHLPIHKASYPLPKDKSIGILAEELGQGVLLVTSFEEIRKDDNAWRLFNQTRDKISSFPITLIVCIPIAPSMTQFMMGNMRDFWSIRNLVVEFRKEPTAEPVLLMDPFLEHSTIANLGLEEKRIEIDYLSTIFFISLSGSIRESNEEGPKLQTSQLERLADQYFWLGWLAQASRIYAHLANTHELSAHYVYLSKLGRTYLELGKEAEALACFQEYLEASKSANRLFQVADAYQHITYFYIRTKNQELAIENFMLEIGQQGAYLERLTSEIESLTNSTQNLDLSSILDIQQQSQSEGDITKAIEILSNLKHLKSQLYSPKLEIRSRNLMGFLCLSVGANDDAIDEYYNAISLQHLPPDGDQLARNMVVSNLAEAYLVSGDYYTAYETAHQAYQEVHKIGDLYLESILLFQLGRIKVAQGLPELGKPHLDEAIRISQYLGSPKLPIMEKFVQSMQA